MAGVWAKNQLQMAEENARERSRRRSHCPSPKMMEAHTKSLKVKTPTSVFIKPLDSEGEGEVMGWGRGYRAMVCE